MENEPISALIVDDEPVARRILRSLLAEIDTVKVVGEAAGVSGAAHLAMVHNPELIFLDVTMSLRSGFELLPLLTGRARVVFVTAFDEYAVRAFEFHAIDYLLKPIRPERLKLAIERVVAQRGQAARAQPTETANAMRQEIVLQTEGHVRVIALKDITVIKAEGNYTKVSLVSGASVLMRRSMTEWAAVLPSANFFRPHRSLYVNFSLLEGVRMVSRDMAEINIRGHKTALTVGRKASLLLRRMLKSAKGEGSGAPSDHGGRFALELDGGLQPVGAENRYSA